MSEILSMSVFLVTVRSSGINNSAVQFLININSLIERLNPFQSNGNPPKKNLAENNFPHYYVHLTI